MNNYFKYLLLCAVSCTSLGAYAMDTHEELVEAARVGNIEKARDLIKAGIDVNARNMAGDTALMWATLSNNKNMVELLLNAVADVSLVSDGGKTALDFAGMSINVTFFQDARLCCREVGSMLLEAYIKQKREVGKKSAENRAMLESKKVELKEMMQQHPGMPQDVIKYIEQFFRV